MIILNYRLYLARTGHLSCFICMIDFVGVAFVFITEIFLSSVIVIVMYDD